MQKVWEWIKSHPYLTGGAVLVVLVILYLINSSSSSSSSSSTSANGGVSDAVATAEINANATLEAAQLQAGVQNAQTASNTTLGLAALQTQTNQVQLNDQTSLDTISLNNAAALQALAINGEISGVQTVNNAQGGKGRVDVLNAVSALNKDLSAITSQPLGSSTSLTTPTSVT